MKNSTKAILAGLWALTLTSCAGTPPKSSEAWSQVPVPELKEEPTWEPFAAALKSHIHKLKSRGGELRYGSQRVTSSDLARSLQWTLEEAQKSPTPHAKFLALIREHFVGVRAYSEPALVTGYYQPVYHARLKPEPPYTQPLYRRPADLLVVDLEAFQKVYSGEHHRSLPTSMRMRGRVKDGKVIPYWSRNQIDQAGALKGQNLEIAYIDPVDAFFLQIQGSGKLLLKNGPSFWVGFADQNGHPYLAVGRRLRDHLTAEQMGMEALREHMHSLTSEELTEFLGENPSYVFFEKRNQRATGSLGLEPVAGRTVAVDPSVYALGGVGFLEFPADSNASSRVVFFQDTGGAIKGSRVDLFLGEGDKAGALAGEFKESARLTVLLPGPEILSPSGPLSKR